LDDVVIDVTGDSSIQLIIWLSDKGKVEVLIPAELYGILVSTA